MLINHCVPPPLPLLRSTLISPRPLTTIAFLQLRTAATAPATRRLRTSRTRRIAWPWAGRAFTRTTAYWPATSSNRAAVKPTTAAASRNRSCATRRTVTSPRTQNVQQNPAFASPDFTWTARAAVRRSCPDREMERGNATGLACHDCLTGWTLYSRCCVPTVQCSSMLPFMRCKLLMRLSKRAINFYYRHLRY